MEDKIPYWDYNVPNPFAQYQDVSTDALIASALFRAGIT